MPDAHPSNPASPRPFVFVLMPFSDSFREVYQLAIRPACIEAGAYCERVDEQVFEGSILTRIYNQIAKADIVIADMSGRNPNVFYETGYAHALGKTTILTTNAVHDIPFDLKHYHHITYSDLITLKDEITNRVRWFIEQRGTASPTNSLVIKINGSDIRQAAPVQARYVPDHYVGAGYELRLTLHNFGTRPLLPGSYALGFITDKLRRAENRGRVWIRYRDKKHRYAPREAMEDGRVLHMLPELGKIFPQGVASMPVLRLLERKPADDSLPVSLRVFNDWGIEDHAFTLRDASAENALHEDLDPS